MVTVPAERISADRTCECVPGFLTQPPDRSGTYCYDSYLSHGASGVTWRVLRNSDQQPFALKITKLDELSEEARRRTFMEVQCLEALQHFACVKLIEQRRTERRLYLVMEYCDAADLFYQLRRLGPPANTTDTSNNSHTPTPSPCPASHDGTGGALQEGEKAAAAPTGMDEYCLKFVLLQLVLGLHHMHHHCHILHRDLKPSNVFLTTNGLVKIGDFGLSFQYESLSDSVGRRICGTPPYLAPELWQGRSYGPAADMWSLGVLLYECMTRHVPFRETEPAALQHSILTSEPAYELSAAMYSAELRYVVRQLLQKAPAARPDTTWLLTYPYIQSALAELPAVLAASAVAPGLRAAIFADIQAQLVGIPALLLRCPAALVFVAGDKAFCAGVLALNQRAVIGESGSEEGQRSVLQEEAEEAKRAPVTPLLLRRSSKHSSPTQSYTTMSARSAQLTNSLALPSLAESCAVHSAMESCVARTITVQDVGSNQLAGACACAYCCSSTSANASTSCHNSTTGLLCCGGRPANAMCPWPRSAQKGRAVCLARSHA